jgi:hypothetical protein
MAETGLNLLPSMSKARKNSFEMEALSVPRKAMSLHFRMGLKLVASIGCTELFIMVIFRLIRIETLMTPSVLF